MFSKVFFTFHQPFSGDFNPELLHIHLGIFARSHSVGLISKLISSLFSCAKSGKQLRRAALQSHEKRQRQKKVQEASVRWADAKEVSMAIAAVLSGWRFHNSPALLAPFPPTFLGTFIRTYLKRIAGSLCDLRFHRNLKWKTEQWQAFLGGNNFLIFNPDWQEFS